MEKSAEQLVLAVVSVLARLLFLVYRIFLTVSVAALVTAVLYGVVGLVHLLCSAVSLQWPWLQDLLGSVRCWAGVVLVLSTLLFVVLRPPVRGQDNPWRKYVGFWGAINKTVDHFIAWIGTVRVYGTPPTAIQETGTYKIRGDEIRELIDGTLQPGDILLRGFDGYLDGMMIGLSGAANAASKHFSHAALFVGDLNEDVDGPQVAQELQIVNDQGAWVDASAADKAAVRSDAHYFSPGRQRVVHAMTKGVFTEDILTFVRCDYLVVLRLPPSLHVSPEQLATYRSTSHAHGPELTANEKTNIHDRLADPNGVPLKDVVAAARSNALHKIGACYDFQFFDAKNHHRFSCSEFVYFCYRSVHAFLGVQLVDHGFLNVLFKRTTITPGDLYNVAAASGDDSTKLRVVWRSSLCKL